MFDCKACTLSSTPSWTLCKGTIFIIMVIIIIITTTITHGNVSLKQLLLAQSNTTNKAIGDISDRVTPFSLNIHSRIFLPTVE